MIDREKVLTVLRRRFPGATPEVVAAAANAIVGLPEEWEDVTSLGPDLGQLLRQSGATCLVAAEQDAEFRLYRKRTM